MDITKEKLNFQALALQDDNELMVISPIIFPQILQNSSYIIVIPLDSSNSRK